MSYRWPFGNWVTVLAIATILAACSKKVQPLDHDAYVWQRRWQAPLTDALLKSADLVRTWRILAAEVDSRGRLHRIPVDLSAVSRSGRPTIPVIRIEGRLALLGRTALIAEIASLQADWSSFPVGTAGLEIDYDCGTRQLSEYAHFLTALRPALSPRLPLSVTLLPDWLGSPQFTEIMEAADETILQVHAVHNPTGALFDPASARAWITALNRIAPKPFKVALPNYGSRIMADELGRIYAVESEIPIEREKINGDGKEMFAEPIAVANFLRSLEKDRPSRLAGIAWFRLPVASDRRAWTSATWRAVISGRELTFHFRSEIQGNDDYQNVILHNDGEIDAPVPASLMVEAPCKGIGSTDGFVLEKYGQDSVFLRSRKALLRAGSRVTVGTVICPRMDARIHINN